MLNYLLCKLRVSHGGRRRGRLGGWGRRADPREPPPHRTHQAAPATGRPHPRTQTPVAAQRRPGSSLATKGKVGTEETGTDDRREPAGQGSAVPPPSSRRAAPGWSPGGPGLTRASWTGHPRRPPRPAPASCPQREGRKTLGVSRGAGSRPPLCPRGSSGCRPPPSKGSAGHTLAGGSSPPVIHCLQCVTGQISKHPRISPCPRPPSPRLTHSPRPQGPPVL